MLPSTFPTIASTAARYREVNKLKKAVEAMFELLQQQGFTGILFGGAAAVFMGCQRSTKDIDINATGMPSLPSDVDPAYLKEKPGVNMQRKKFTFWKDDPDMSVKCDISSAKADIVRAFYARYTITLPELNGVLVAAPPLLLADKIHTYNQRHEVLQVAKQISDLRDIEWCLSYMHAHDIKMDQALRRLYTVDEWNIVKCAMKDSNMDMDLVDTAEGELDVIAPLEGLNAVDE